MTVQDKSKVTHRRNIRDQLHCLRRERRRQQNMRAGQNIRQVGNQRRRQQPAHTTQQRRQLADQALHAVASQKVAGGADEGLSLVGGGGREEGGEVGDDGFDVVEGGGGEECFDSGEGGREVGEEAGEVGEVELSGREERGHFELGGGVG